VAQKNLQPGQHIQPGQPLLTIIPMNTVWVDANFKESQLRNLRIGQSAIVKSDLYGNDVIYHGKVTGISAGTGAAFALLPPQNAAGNWIKVIQRVPVRIALDAREVEQHPLRVGLSMQVEVDTHDRSGTVIPVVGADSFKAETSIYDVDVSQAVAQAEAIITRQP
jgi:membrane fusion protein (multidrug efflux system)